MKCKKCKNYWLKCICPLKTNSYLTYLFNNIQRWTSFIVKNNYPEHDKHAIDQIDKEIGKLYSWLKYDEREFDEEEIKHSKGELP